MRCITLSELLESFAICIAIIACIAALWIVPDIREWLGLEEPSLKGRVARVILLGIISLALLGIIAVLIWFFLCPLLSSSEQSRNDNVPLPEMTPKPKPTPKTHGPIIEEPPVEVSGAEFTLYVFSQEYHWSYGKVEAEFNRKPVAEVQMISYLTQLSGSIEPADAIICVGTASGDIQKDEPFEEGRAFSRAEQLIIWTRPAISATGKQLDVYRLNLGHYRELSDEDNQRLIIVIAVKRVDPNISIDDLLSHEKSGTLKQKLKEKNFPFSFDAYSMFDLHKKT